MPRCTKVTHIRAEMGVLLSKTHGYAQKIYPKMHFRMLYVSGLGKIGSSDCDCDLSLWRAKNDRSQYEQGRPSIQLANN
jgi:hypothetical protein